jgi:hypothetical protein
VSAVPDVPPPAPRPARTERDVDRAALLGTALAAVVALTFGGQGEWDWLAAAAGVALLLVLAAFFRLPAGGAATRRGRAELAAACAVGALAATLVLAPVLQASLAATDAGRTCRASAAVAAGALESDGTRQRGAEVAVARGDVGGTAGEALARAARDEERTVLGNCLGAITSRWLWVPAAVLAAAGYALARWLARRRQAPSGP